MPQAYETITISPQRYIGTITALVFFEERGTDRATITRHPVEQGAEISDHVYDEMPELIIRCGATNSSPDAGGDEGYVTNLYAQLLTLKQSKTTMSVQTGKRLYQNMLIEMMELITDEKTEAALMLTINLRGLLIAQTQVVSVPPAANMASPQNNAAVQQSGTKQPTPVTTQVPAPVG
jgi:hypothetical protein